MLTNVAIGLMMPNVIQRELESTSDRHELSAIINSALDSADYWCSDEQYWTRVLAGWFQTKTGYIFVRDLGKGVTWLTSPF